MSLYCESLFTFCLMCRTCQSSLPLTGATVFKVYEEPAEEIVPEEPPEEVVEEPEPAPPPKGT